MSTFLLDGNVLIALTVVDHVHHGAAIEWFEGDEPTVATCPITQGTLLRFLIREGQTAPEACAVLDAITAQPWHEFWPDGMPYRSDHLAGVIGHRQVTDAYLVALARERGARLTTFDKGLAALHPDVAVRLGD